MSLCLSITRTTKVKNSDSGRIVPVVVPEESLVKKFLEVASVNSSRNIETLGLVAGKLVNERYVLSHLIIPSQTGTNDTCELIGFETVSKTFLKENLIQLGWIHTHPTFDVFLSSVDMHTQYKFQRLLPETMAIVCSIRHKTHGFLKLSDSGMAEIGSCERHGFHPHSPNIVVAVDNIIVDNNFNVEVIDLRLSSTSDPSLGLG